ncbi:MAG TPA: ABC transporter ATP-binding protein [Acidimicrobiales bacterium]|nr:ABC transporter ATP-binding protein [Acidimicrobiales bacterium]
MPERITIEHLVKVYSGGNRALDDVSLEVDPGTFLVLLGPSGSGKTTLLRAIAGIERITGGRMAIGDSNVADGQHHVPPERRDLSMVFQDYALWPHMVARDNVAFALKRRGLGRVDARRAAMAMLERVGLGSLAERYPTELSGGEQQRVALARALVGGTGLILCDEPLSNLDADLRERMRVEISSLVRAAGATTIYITHDQSEAFALADRVGVLERGRLVQLGSPEEIYASPSTAFVARFTGLAGELEVRVRTQPDDSGCVEVEAMALPGSRSIRVRVGERTIKDRAARLMVRPTGVRLCPADTGEHHLHALVADVAFRGRGYEHAVDLSNGNRINSIFSELRVERGCRVGLRLETAGCLLFPADDEHENGEGEPIPQEAQALRVAMEPYRDPVRLY